MGDSCGLENQNKGCKMLKCFIELNCIIWHIVNIKILNRAALKCSVVNPRTILLEIVN